MDIDVRGVTIGFGGAIAVLAALVYVVGVDGVLTALAMLGPEEVGLLVVTTAAYLVAWSLALRTVLSALDIEASVQESVLLFASATFANNITPFGQAGGEPFSALLVSRATGSEYESALASMASVDTINFIPSIALSLLGLSYYLAVFAVGDRLLFVAAVVVALAVGVPILAYGLWRIRSRVQTVAVRAIHPITRSVGELVPYWTVPERPHIRERVQGFFRAIERVAESRTTLTEALVLSTAGWMAMAAALFVSLGAVGHSVPVAAALIAAPVGAIASLTPLPGGLGGVELAIVIIIVPITPVSPEVAASAALIYRGATYWLPTVAGGIATAWLEGRVTR
ncbi:MAG: YbhN family protein [Halobacteriaceae archaeon]